MELVELKLPYGREKQEFHKEAMMELELEQLSRTVDTGSDKEARVKCKDVSENATELVQIIVPHKSLL